MRVQHELPPRSPRLAAVALLATVVCAVALAHGPSVRTMVPAPLGMTAVTEQSAAPPASPPSTWAGRPAPILPKATPAPTIVASTIVAPAVVAPARTFRPYPPNVTRWHDLSLAAGWTERQWRQHLQCIIARESGGLVFPPRHDATGLLQILRSRHPGVDLEDPLTNLTTGHEMFLVAGWSPWYYAPKPCY